MGQGQTLLHRSICKTIIIIIMGLDDCMYLV
jgi:hypothetical protein